MEGSSDNPIKLPETSTEEIENLLRFFYFGYKTCHWGYHSSWLTMNLDIRMHDDYVATLADWVAMLSISTRLMFEKVRKRAIKEITPRLDKIETFELIRLAIKFDVEQWLKHSYRRLVTRAEPITHAESAKIPVHVIIMLTRSREQYWRNNNNNSRNHSQSDPDAIIEAEIRLIAAEYADGKGVV